MPQLNVTGEVQLIDGVLHFIDRTKGTVGYMYVGSDGIVIEQVVGKGELILFSLDDPPKLRFAARSSHGERKFKLGGFSFNWMRPDDRCEELALVSGSVAEDADIVAGDLRGQLEEFVRPDTRKDLQQTRVTTTAYADDLVEIGIDPVDPRTGFRRLWTGLRNRVEGMWKFD